MAHATVNVYGRYTEQLILEIGEHTPDFDFATVDHDYLADQIGKAVVRAINHCRTMGKRLSAQNFVVHIAMED